MDKINQQLIESHLGPTTIVKCTIIYLKKTENHKFFDFYCSRIC